MERFPAIHARTEKFGRLGILASEIYRILRNKATLSRQAVGYAASDEGMARDRKATNERRTETPVYAEKDTKKHGADEQE